MTHHSSVSLQNATQGINITDYLDRLTPAKRKRGRYHCPICHDDNLTISGKTNPDGTHTYTCQSNGCDRGKIARVIAPEKFEKNFNGPIPGTRPRKKQKSSRQRDRDTQVNAAIVETKIDELVEMVAIGSYETDAEALLTLTSWCKEHGYEKHIFPATQLFRQRLKTARSQCNDTPSLEATIDNLVSQDLEGSQLTLLLTALAEEFHKPLNQVEKIYYQRRKEAEVAQQAKDAGTDLANLQQIRQGPLPIAAGLHGDGGRLAWQLRATAEAMPTAPDFLATTLIPVLASRIGTSQTLVIKAAAGYSVRPIFRTLIVAPTGRKKSPAQKSIISVLTELESVYYQTYKNELEQFEQDLDQWKPGGDAPKPSPPVRRRYISTDDTLAARIQVHKENPAGLLLYRDEGSAFVTERGRFNNSRGDGGETEADLSEFGGGALSRDRKADGSTFLAKTGISRTGAIQYAKLRQLMGDHQDDCGEWARYLFCAAPVPPSYIDLMGEDTDTGLQKTLIDLIQRLGDLPERAYLLSHNAKLVFMAYQHQLTDRAMETDHPALASALPKFESYFARFILLLHVVNAVLAGQQPAATVSAHTAEMARQWTEYFYGQFQLLMALNSPQEKHVGDLLRLRDYIERRPGRDLRKLVGARIFQRDEDKSKSKTPYIRSLVNSLIEQGYVSESDGKYVVVEHPVEHVEQPVQKPQHTITPSPQQTDALRATPPAPIAIDTPVEITYPNGEAPPPDAPSPGTRGVVAAVSEEDVTILVNPLPEAPDIPLGQRFRSVLRKHVRPLAIAGSSQ